MEQKHTDYYSVRIIAEMLSVSRVTVFRYIRDGKMAAVRHKGDYFVSEREFYLYRFRYRTTRKLREESGRIVACLRDALREGL